MILDFCTLIFHYKLYHESNEITQWISLSRQLYKFNIFLAHVPTRSIHSLIFNFKPVFPPLDSIGIVYKIPCLDCNSIYIGESGRRLRVRIDDHRNACKSQGIKSKIFQHSINLDYRPNFSNPSILIKNYDNTIKRIFFWGLYYSHLNLLVAFRLNLLFLFDFNLVFWNFNISGSVCWHHFVR